MTDNNKAIKSLWGYPLIDSKARSGINDIKNNFQKKTDDTLSTTNKNIVDAINEVNTQCKDIVDKKIDNVALSDNRLTFLANNKNIKTITLPSTTGGTSDDTIKTISSKVLATVPASSIKLDNGITVNNVSINKDRRYYIEFLGNKKLCNVMISKDMGNSIICSIKGYIIQALNIEQSTNLTLFINNTNAENIPISTNLVIYEEEVKYLDSKYLETDLTLQNSISMGRTGNIGMGSVALGAGVEASGSGSFAQGGGTTASGDSSHAEGHSTTASGDSSHAEGDSTTASGNQSHAEGHSTTASGNQSHAEGEYTIASGDNQHVQGKYNIEDTTNKYAHIVGNGTDDSTRANAHTLDWQGNGWFAGKLSQEGTPTEDKDLTTKKYVDNIKTDINNIKTDLGTEELFTGKSIKQSINEVNAQYKDIVNQNRYCVVTFPGYIFEKITKWNALGDSITEGMSTDKIYHEYIADTYPNLTVRNYGISSTEICTGGTFPNPMCERYVNMDDDADLITVFGGVNDYGHNAPLGSFSVRDNSTFYGGLRTLIEGLLNKYPSKMIYFFTPIKYRGCNNKNTQGKTLEDYVNVVKEVCNYYSVPCVDLYNSNSLNPDIDFINTKYFADGLHPNKDGHLVLARTLTYISDSATNVKVKDITVATGTPIGENIYKQTEYLQNGNSGFWHSDGYFVEATQYHSASVDMEPGGTYQVLYDNSAFNHTLYITFIKGNTFVKQMEKNLNQTTYRFPNDIDYDAVCICNLDGMDLSKVSIRAISGTGTTPGADSGDTYYSVAYALNNCSSSNSSTSILKGNSYTAIITANSNYTMKSITVTMGGIDITSTAVSGNRISINNITGDIKITATAESSGSDVVSTITPLSATLTPTGNNIYDGSTFKKDGVDGFFDSNLKWNPTDTYLSTNISVTPGGKYQILYNGNTVSKNVFITLIKDSTPVKYFDMGLNSSNYQFPNNIDFNICAIVCLDSLDFSKITVKVIS